MYDQNHAEQEKKGPSPATDNAFFLKMNILQTVLN